MLSITKKYITKNDCYKQGRTIVPKGIIVHSLGVPQPDIDKVYDSFNQPNYEKAVHALVNDKKIYNIMPWNYRPWGCYHGDKGSGNDTHIQFEICEPSGFTYKPNSSIMIGYDAAKNQEYFNTIWANSVDLAAYLCETYKLSPNTIICHSEAYTKGIASNHADVMHWFPKHEKTMDDFRQAVADKLSHVPDKNITINSSNDDIKWLQTQLNKANKNYQIPVTGVYDQKTRIALLMYADCKGWDWSNTWGYTAKTATIKSLAKL